MNQCVKIYFITITNIFYNIILKKQKQLVSAFVEQILENKSVNYN